MKVGYIQTSPIFGEKEENFDQVLELVGDKKADLLVLPELFATGYTIISKQEAYEMAENINGITAKFMKKLSKKTNAVIVGGFIERDGSEVYNSSLIVYKNEFVYTYRKIHLFSDEKKWFSPGDKPFTIFEIKGVKLGVMICFDWMFPEAMRTLALSGAEIVAHPANLVLPYCQDAMVTRSLENRVFSITANRIGNEKRGEYNLSFTGKSQIVSYDGTVLSSASENKMDLDILDIDVYHAKNKYLNQKNNLFKDRQPELYRL